MAQDRLLEIYANAKGAKPMKLLGKISNDELPGNVARAIEGAVELLNSFPREVES